MLDQGIDDSGPEHSKLVSSLLTDGRYAVEILDFGWNSVGNEGAVVLAGALQVNTSL